MDERIAWQLKRRFFIVQKTDGEEQDAYILGVDIPVKEFAGKVIAVIHRHDDVVSD